jgi:hypothetical protein
MDFNLIKFQKKAHIFLNFMYYDIVLHTLQDQVIN